MFTDIGSIVVIVPFVVALLLIVLYIKYREMQDKRDMVNHYRQVIRDRWLR